MDIDEVADQLMDKVHAAVTPDKASKQEALDLYEFMAHQCEVSARAMKEEMR